MLEDLYTTVVPDLPRVDLSRRNWDILQDLTQSMYPRIESTLVDWVIVESVNGVPVFSMDRNKLSLQRHTVLDTYGLLGLSQINLNDRSVILTEGVSDYFTARLLCPDRNVLGVTTLGGSKNAKKIILNLFDSVCICSDNDDTGRKNSMNWRLLLRTYNKSCTIFTPVASFKDITDNFIYNLKLSTV